MLDKNQKAMQTRNIKTEKEQRDFVRLLPLELNDAQIDEILIAAGFIEVVKEVEITSAPDIKSVFDLLFTEKRDYGMFWVANKLVEKGIQGHKNGYENVYTTWVAKNDKDFIWPKTYGWDQKVTNVRTKFISIHNVGSFKFTIHIGCNGNCSLTLSFIDSSNC